MVVSFLWAYNSLFWSVVYGLNVDGRITYHASNRTRHNKNRSTFIFVRLIWIIYFGEDGPLHSAKMSLCTYQTA